MENLYEEYGKCMIQQEILQGRINEIKRKIAQQINAPIEPKKEDGS